MATLLRNGYLRRVGLINQVNSKKTEGVRFGHVSLLRCLEAPQMQSEFDSQGSHLSPLLSRERRM